MKHVVCSDIEIVRLATVNDGSQLELSCSHDGLVHQLITLVADEKDESLWAEVESCGKLFRIPLQILQRAIEAAPEDVHSERWYEKNLPGYCEDDLTVAARANAKRTRPDNT